MIRRRIACVAAGMMASFAAARDIPEAQAREIAIAFRTFAASAGGSTIIGPPPLNTSGEFEADAPQGLYELVFGDGVAVISRADGKVITFSLYARTGFSESWDTANALTESEVLTLMNMYYNQAGFPGSLSMFGMIQDDDMGGPPHCWRGLAKQYQSGVELHMNYDVSMWVEHVSGRLVSLMIALPPNPASDTTPDISAVTALFNFTNYLYQKTGETGFIIRQAMRPVIWVPDSKDLSPNFNQLTSMPQYNVYKQNNQGYLTYWCLLESTQSSMGKGLPRWYFGHVDAHTGVVLGAFVPGAFGAKPEDKPNPFAWDLGVGPIELVGKGKVVQGADVFSQPAPKTPPKSGYPVMLRRGRWVVVCEFDSKSGLLWATRGGLRHYGKPNDRLLGALRSAARG